MGIEWSTPKKVKGNTLMLVVGKIPEKGQPYNNELWTLWKQRQKAIKEDGFSIKKDTYHPGNNWNVNYFHEVTPNSFEKNNQNKYMWEAEFHRRVNKWKDVIENLQSALDNPEDAIVSIRGKTKAAGKAAGKGKGPGPSAVDDDFEAFDEPISEVSTSMQALLDEFNDLDDGLEIN